MTDVKVRGLVGMVVNSGRPRGGSQVLSVPALPEADLLQDTSAHHSSVRQWAPVQAAACLRHKPVLS